jgi:hypothetical protein
VLAQESPEAAAAEYFAANRVQAPERLQRAFHPSAMTYWHDETFGVRGLTQFGWRAAMSKRDRRVDTKQRVFAIDQAGDAAVLTAMATVDGETRVEFLLLLKLHSRWRIVGHTYAPGEGARAQDEEAHSAIRHLTESKLASDRAWDGQALLATMHRRGVVLTTDSGDFVAASPHEWSARYDERRDAGTTMRPIKQRIESIHTAGNVGYVRWTIRWSDGSAWTDFALVVRDQSRWVFLNLAFVPGAW